MHYSKISTKEFLVYALLAGGAAALPHSHARQSPNHARALERRAKDGTNKIEGCTLGAKLNTPVYPDADSIFLVQDPLAGLSPDQVLLRNTVRQGMFGDLNANAASPKFPHWIEARVYHAKGDTAFGLVEFTKNEAYPRDKTGRLDKATDGARDPAIGAVFNVDHVFEHYTLRRFLGMYVGAGDPADITTTPPVPAKCTAMKATYMVKPTWMPAGTEGPFNRIYDIGLPGMETTNPAGYNNGGDFAGLHVWLNTAKGHLFQGEMEKYYTKTYPVGQTPDWAQTFDEAGLAQRMGDLEKISLVFELMSKPKMQGAYKRTVKRIHQALMGLDNYLLNGNVNAGAWVPFTNSDVAGPFTAVTAATATHFRTWLPQWLTFLNNQAFAFFTARWAELEIACERDVGPQFLDAATKDVCEEILQRMENMRVQNRHSQARLSFSIADMTEWADPADKIELYGTAIVPGVGAPP